MHQAQPTDVPAVPRDHAVTVVYPKPTAQVAPYVDVLGAKLTIRFLLAFGGADLPISKNPRESSRLAHVIGLENARALATVDHLLQRRVPLAKRWLAECLRAEGYSVSDTARTLRVSDVSVRRWLNT